MSTRRLNDLLNLSHVVNWHNVPTVRKQSVAEHSFRVAVIALELCERINGPVMPSRVVIEAQVLRWALVHDGPESETGDMPGTTKAMLDLQMWFKVECKFCPWYIKEDHRVHRPERTIVKIADLMEQIMFAHSSRLVTDGKSELRAAEASISVRLYNLVQDSKKMFGWEQLSKDVIDILDSCSQPSDTRHAQQLESEVDANVGDADPGAAPNTVHPPKT